MSLGDYKCFGKLKIFQSRERWQCVLEMSVCHNDLQTRFLSLGLILPDVIALKSSNRGREADSTTKPIIMLNISVSVNVWNILTAYCTEYTLTFYIVFSRNFQAFNAAIIGKTPLFQVETILSAPEIILHPNFNEIFKLIAQCYKGCLETTKVRPNQKKRFIPC